MRNEMMARASPKGWRKQTPLERERTWNSWRGSRCSLGLSRVWAREPESLVTKQGIEGISSGPEA